jgi:hypothetical protein
MEKPGGPEGAPRQLKPEKPDQADLIKPSGGPQGGADKAQAQGQGMGNAAPFPTFRR